MQMNPQSFLGSTQYPSVTLGSVHMYATPTTQYMAAGPTTHYNASSHHHQVSQKLSLIVSDGRQIVFLVGVGSRLSGSASAASKCTEPVH